MAILSRRNCSAVALLSCFVLGCAEEWEPERFSETMVRGIVTIGPRPVGGGWITIEPAEGNRGNLRMAPIGSDGTFVMDRAPTGRVIVGFDAIPAVAGSVETHWFRPIRSPIRRTIPEGRESSLPIDLIVETAKIGRTPRRSRRRRDRASRKTRKPEVAKDPAIGPENTSPKLHDPQVRVIYRDGSGAIHLDWPANQVAQAVDDPKGIVWVDIMDVESANNAGVEAMLREVFHFHPLAIEDALKDTHVPKVDDWGKFLYIVVDSLDFDPETDDLRLHELDIFLGPNYLLTYHNETIEVLDRHRRNLEREPEDRLRHTAAHLLYRLLDEVVSVFLPAIEHLDRVIDDAQDEIFDSPSPRTLRKIFHVKQNGLRLHRVLVPMREVLNRLARDCHAQIHAEDRIYFRDVYDDLVRLHDIIESLRDLIAGALDTYLSVVSNRTNEIMKALTLVSVMFLPLTFVVGFFGMNFFGETLMFVWPPLPKATLFWLSCAGMIATPILLAFIAWKRRWF